MIQDAQWSPTKFNLLKSVQEIEKLTGGMPLFQWSLEKDEERNVLVLAIRTSTFDNNIEYNLSEELKASAMNQYIKLVRRAATIFGKYHGHIERHNRVIEVWKIYKEIHQIKDAFFNPNNEYDDDQLEKEDKPRLTPIQFNDLDKLFPLVSPSSNPEL